MGFEPTNGGFADLSLGPLGYRAKENQYSKSGAWRVASGEWRARAAAERIECPGVGVAEIRIKLCRCALRQGSDAITLSNPIYDSGESAWWFESAQPKAVATTS